jgi:DNA-nicking Smr family endonuclease
MKRLDKDVALADDDNAAWAAEIKSIKKLAKTEEKPSAPLIIGEIHQNINYAAVYSGNSLRPLNVGDIDNIDKRTAEKFKRGEFKLQSTLDLHGKTEKQAFEEVSNFVRNAYMQKLRYIMIITGKGINKAEDLWYEKKGILKESVPNWLNGAELRPLILSFCYARPEDGGEGALYVLLRRHR